jgi:hypothetical protein
MTTVEAIAVAGGATYRASNVDSDLRVANIALELLGDGLLQLGLSQARGLKGAGEGERYQSGIVDLVFARQLVLAKNCNPKFIAAARRSSAVWGAGLAARSGLTPLQALTKHTRAANPKTRWHEAALRQRVRSPVLIRGRKESIACIKRRQEPTLIH